MQDGTETKEIVGVDDLSRASPFYVFEKDSKNVFNIAYYGETEEERYTGLSLYLTTHTTFGRDEGPLEIGGIKATDFILSHPSKEEEDVSIEFWETDGCFVRRNPEKFHCTSFMAFDEANMSTLCVSSLKYEGRDHTWLRFQLHRTRTETEERMPVFGGPIALHSPQPEDCISKVAAELQSVDIEVPGEREEAALPDEENGESDKLINI